ncbi:e3 ubiquitin-protein ligase huwe1 [Anaeramoeba ignava]|uniref:HECT-type E3 ubiquitin transferase n=1 Tax=Anaeramoeba ignava TaxID=1746090 RepID=A0A9Q0REP5_ANAIG|nr:e3 ubiquitin-protein ligase huwe1 [Anaeramoeba ignava]
MKIKAQITKYTPPISSRQKEVMDLILSTKTNEELYEILIKNSKRIFYNKIDLIRWADVFNKFDEILEKEKISNSLTENLKNSKEFNEKLIISILLFSKNLLKNSNDTINLYNSENYIKSLLEIGGVYLRPALELLQVLYSRVSPSGSNQAFIGSKQKTFYELWEWQIFSIVFSYSQSWLFDSDVHKLTFLECANLDEKSEIDPKILEQAKYIEFHFLINQQLLKENKRKLKPKKEDLKEIKINFFKWENVENELKNLMDKYHLPEQLLHVIYSKYQRFLIFQNGPLNIKNLAKIRLVSLRTFFELGPKNNTFIKEIKKREPDLVEQLIEVITTEKQIDEEFKVLVMETLNSMYTHSYFQEEILEKGNILVENPQFDKKYISGIVENAMEKYETPMFDVQFIRHLMKFLQTISKSQIGGSLYAGDKSWITCTLILLKDRNSQSLHTIFYLLELWSNLIKHNIRALQYFQEQNEIQSLLERVDFDLEFFTEESLDEQSFISHRKIKVLISSFRLIGQLVTSDNDNKSTNKLEMKPIIDTIKRVFQKEYLCLKIPNLFSRTCDLLGIIASNEEYMSLINKSRVLKLMCKIMNISVPNSASSVSIISKTVTKLSTITSGASFINRSKIYKPILSLLIKPQYIPIMSKRVASELGQEFEILVRHLPNLLEDIIDMIIGMIEGICLQKTTELSENDPKIQDDSTESTFCCFVDNIARFLERFLSSVQNMNCFINKKGIETCLKIFTSPALPNTFYDSTAALSLNKMFQIISAMNMSQFTQSLITITVSHFRKLKGKKEYFKNIETIQTAQTIYSFVKLLSDFVLKTSLNEIEDESSPEKLLTQWSSPKALNLVEYFGEFLNEIEWQESRREEKEEEEKKKEKEIEKEIEDPKQSIINHLRREISHYLVGIYQEINYIILASLLSNNNKQKNQSSSLSVVLLAETISKTLLISLKSFIDKKQQENFSMLTISELRYIIRFTHRFQSLILTEISSTKAKHFDSLNTILVVLLDQNGTIDLILKLFQNLTENINENENENNFTMKSKLFGIALEKLAILIHTISSIHKFLSSPITKCLVSFTFSNKSKSFRKYKFLYRLQSKILKEVVIKKWEDPKLKFGPLNFIKKMLLIINTKIEELHTTFAKKKHQKQQTNQDQQEQNISQIKMDTSMEIHKSDITVRTLRKEIIKLIQPIEKELVPRLLDILEARKPQEIEKEIISIIKKQLKRQPNSQSNSNENQFSYLEMVVSQIHERVQKTIQIQPFPEKINNLMGVLTMLLIPQEKPPKASQLKIKKNIAYQEFYPQTSPTTKTTSTTTTSSIFNNQKQLLSIVFKHQIIPTLEEIISKFLDYKEKALINQNIWNPFLTLTILLLDNILPSKSKRNYYSELVKRSLKNKTEEHTEILVYQEFDKVDDHLKKFTEFSVKLLQIKSDSYGLEALLRFISKLTTYFHCASLFAEMKGLEHLIQIKKSKNNFFRGYALLVNSILRNVVEDPITFKTAIIQEIKATFPELAKKTGADETKQPRVDLITFIKHYSKFISRDPNLFIKSISSVCRLHTRRDPSNNYQIKLINEKKDEIKQKNDEDEDEDEDEKTKVFAEEIVSLLSLSLESQESKDILCPEVILLLLLEFTQSYENFGKIILDSKIGNKSFLSFVINHLLPIKLFDQSTSFAAIDLVVLLSSEDSHNEVWEGLLELVGTLNKLSEEKLDQEDLFTKVLPLVDLILALIDFHQITTRNLQKPHFLNSIIFRLFFISFGNQITKNILSFLKKLDLNHPHASEFIYSHLSLLELFVQVFTSPHLRILLKRQKAREEKKKIKEDHQKDFTQYQDRTSTNQRIEEILEVIEHSVLELIELSKQGREVDIGLIELFEPLSHQFGIDFGNFLGNQKNSPNYVNKRRQKLKKHTRKRRKYLLSFVHPYISKIYNPEFLPYNANQVSSQTTKTESPINLRKTITNIKNQHIDTEEWSMQIIASPLMKYEEQNANLNENISIDDNDVDGDEKENERESIETIYPIQQTSGNQIMPQQSESGNQNSGIDWKAKINSKFNNLNSFHLQNLFGNQIIWEVQAFSPENEMNKEKIKPTQISSQTNLQEIPDFVKLAKMMKKPILNKLQNDAFTEKPHSQKQPHLTKKDTENQFISKLREMNIDEVYILLLTKLSTGLRNKLVYFYLTKLSRQEEVKENENKDNQLKDDDYETEFDNADNVDDDEFENLSSFESFLEDLPLDVSKEIVAEIYKTGDENFISLLPYSFMGQLKPEQDEDLDLEKIKNFENTIHTNIDVLKLLLSNEQVEMNMEPALISQDEIQTLVNLIVLPEESSLYFITDLTQILDHLCRHRESRKNLLEYILAPLGCSSIKLDESWYSKETEYSSKKEPNKDFSLKRFFKYFGYMLAVSETDSNKNQTAQKSGEIKTKSPLENANSNAISVALINRVLDIIQPLTKHSSVCEYLLTEKIEISDDTTNQDLSKHNFIFECLLKLFSIRTFGLNREVSVVKLLTILSKILSQYKISHEFPIPTISQDISTAFINILLRDNFPEQSFSLALSIVEKLFLNPENQEQISDRLIFITLKIAKHVWKDLCLYQKDLSKIFEKENQLQDIAKFSKTYILKNTNFLHLIQTDLKTLNSYQIENLLISQKSTFQFKDLWDVLNNCLELILSIHEKQDNNDLVIKEKVSFKHSFRRQTKNKPNQKNKKIQEQTPKIKKKKSKSKTSLTNVLIPLVSSFFILHGNEKISNDESIVVDFAKTNCKVLNTIVYSHLDLLNSSFKVLTEIPDLLTFENKKRYFRQMLDNQKKGKISILNISVRRKEIFKDSLLQIRNKSQNKLRIMDIQVQFLGEKAKNLDTLKKEWFIELTRSFVDQKQNLFSSIQKKPDIFHIDPQSSKIHNYFEHFHFIGEIIGKAIYEEICIPIHFSLPFYKNLIRQQISYSDLQFGYFDIFEKIRKYLSENEDNEDQKFGKTFSIEYQNEVIDLISNGRNVPVKKEKKMKFVNLATEYFLSKMIQRQINSIVNGINTIFPIRLLKIFTPNELELLICGIPLIKIEDLKEKAILKEDSKEIKFFWDVLKNLEIEERAKFIQVVTGSTSSIRPKLYIKIQQFKNHYFSKFEIINIFNNELILPKTDDFEEISKIIYQLIRNLDHFNFFRWRFPIQLTHLALNHLSSGFGMCPGVFDWIWPNPI